MIPNGPARRRREGLKLGLLLPMFCFFNTACTSLVLFGAGAAAGVAGYVFYKGSLTVVYQASYLKTWDATIEVLKEMDLRIVHSEHWTTKGKIVAERSDKKPIYISMEYKSAEETELSIRVGEFGDKEASDGIIEKIRKALFE
jgi:hypothetical protein